MLTRYFKIKKRTIRNTLIVVHLYVILFEDFMRASIKIVYMREVHAALKTFHLRKNDNSNIKHASFHLGFYTYFTLVMLCIMITSRLHG